MDAKPTKSQQQDNDADYLAAVDEGLVDAKAGRLVPYEKVRRWLLSWGTDHELPPPKVPQGR
jgi:predicted transcriptional regulator